MARIRRPQKGPGPTPPGSAAPWRVAKYIRLSREDGNDESNSVVNQRKILDERIEATFQGACVVVGEYVDDGLTGTDDSRADFQRMIYDIETGRVNCVITKNLSRAFRNHADQGHYLESYFPLHNVRLITISDTVPLDTYMQPEAVYGFEVPITGVMNDRYAYKTSVDVRATFRTKRSRGEFIGAFAPYGYDKDPADRSKLLIDEEAARVVREIYAWFVRDGLSIHGVALRLNERGEPNPTEYKRRRGLAYHNPHTRANDGLWSPKTVQSILKNRMYVGTMVQGQQRVINYKVHDRVNTPEEEWFVVPGTHEAIVPQNLFAQAQRLLARDTRTAPQQRQVHLFAGLVRCADCKKAMTRKVSKGHGYLSCRTHREKSKTKCAKHSIREDALQRVVLLVLQRQIGLLASPAALAEAARKAPAAQPASARLDLLLRQRRAELEKVLNAVDNLYTDWKNDDLTREEYLRLKAGLTQRADQLRENLRNIAGEREALAGDARAGEPFLPAFLEHGNVTRLERGLLVELVDAIYVFEDGAVQIDFLFADPYRRALDHGQADGEGERSPVQGPG